MGISTHILDTALGRPAADVPVSLAIWQSAEWVLLNSVTTDADGRAKYLLPVDQPLTVGLYRARFETSVYYQAQRLQGLYPFVEIVFEVRDAAQHFHIPLLLTANGYSTYRGS